MPRRSGNISVLDHDAIWRGEIDDVDIVMTATERAEIDARQTEERRRRLLVELFGDPVGTLAIEDGVIRHRRRSGTQHGAPLDTRRTAGCREEIQIAVLAHPVVTTELIAEHDLLASRRRVCVDSASEERIARQLSWNATVRTTPWSNRRSRLRIYGSPSSNITILALAPIRTHRWGVRRFLRVGLKEMFQLRDAIEERLVGAASRADGPRPPT